MCKNHIKSTFGGVAEALWEALGIILTPGAAQRPKRQENSGSLVAFGLLFGALLAHFSAHRRTFWHQRRPGGGTGNAKELTFTILGTLVTFGLEK